MVVTLSTQHKTTTTIEFRIQMNNHLEQISNKGFSSDAKPKFRFPG